MVRKIIAFETAEEGFDQAVGLRAAAGRATGDQSQSRQQLLELIRDELRSVVGQELQTFGLLSLMGKAAEQRFAEEFANILCGQSRLYPIPL
jgi:hypothetical protein